MSTYTPSLGLELITPGSQAGLWGNTTNNSMNLIDQAITGVTELSFAAANGTTQVLTDDNGAANQARAAVLNITGSASGTNTVVVPNKQKMYLVRNDTGQTVIFQTAVPVNTYPIEAGYSILIFCDGNNNVFTGIAAPSVGTLSVSAGGTGTTSFGAGGFIKSTGGTNALSVASKVALASDVSGTLPVANGGTGAVSLVNGGLLVGQGTGAVASLVGAVNGYIPTWNSATNSWVAAAPASGGVSSVAVTSPLTITGTASNPVINLPTLGVTNGGTGSTTAAGALTNLGALSAANGVAYDSSRLGGTLASSYLTSSSGTAYDSSRLGGTLASGYVTTSGSQTISGTKTFSSGGGISMGSGSGIAILSGGSISSQSYNFAATTSWFTAGAAINAAVNGFTTLTTYGSGDLQIYGSNAIKASGTTWINPSDIRLKDNIQDYTKGLQELKQINPKTWTFNGKGGSLYGAKGRGVVADEIQTVLPDSVSTYSAKLNESDETETEIKNFNADEIIWMLVNSVKELEARIAVLEAK